MVVTLASVGTDVRTCISIIARHLSMRLMIADWDLMMCMYCISVCLSCDLPWEWSYNVGIH